MSVVQLGTNEFRNCRVILAFKDDPFVAVKTDPLRITLHIPPNPNRPAAPQVSIEDGVIRPGGEEYLLVKGSRESSAVFFREQFVLVAVQRDVQTVHLKIDFRPFGLSIFDDTEGLHIGTNLFARNVIENADVAIALA